MEESRVLYLKHRLGYNQEHPRVFLDMGARPRRTRSSLTSSGSAVTFLSSFLVSPADASRLVNEMDLGELEERKNDCRI